MRGEAGVGWIAMGNLLVTIAPGNVSAMVVFRERTAADYDPPTHVVAVMDLEEVLTHPKDQNLALENGTVLTEWEVLGLRDMLWATINQLLEKETS